MEIFGGTIILFNTPKDGVDKLEGSWDSVVLPVLHLRGIFTGKLEDN